MHKILKYIIAILATLLLIWLSLDIQNLQKHRDSVKLTQFNASNYAENFWNDSIPVCISEAPNIIDLAELLNENSELAFQKHGHKLGISSTYYFMLKGTGKIESVDADYLLITISNRIKVKIITDFIYGNAVREGSGKVNINNFVNMTDFNTVSVAINKLVKERVALRLKSSAKIGQELNFVGAFEINEKNIDLNGISIIPVSAKITNGKSE